ncbi:MAG: hypothetical protein K2X81_11715 [Candidatus Obscuribacterales bacterium]|nr:hypothetical protein [Candidatus Obscuribacterales bacterium]
MLLILSWGNCIAQISAHFQAESSPILVRKHRPLSSGKAAHFGPEYTVFDVLEMCAAEKGRGKHIKFYLRRIEETQLKLR